MHTFAASAPALPLAVAYSGGADSTALLLACAAQWPGQLEAWHIHHGLQAAADDFERHCAATCQQLGVPLRVQRVQVPDERGQSTEAAARAARYAAFDQLAAASGVRTLALAHHADDQAETLLLALSRGAGLPGLAAMPARWQRGALHCVRPLLDVPGADIRHWLRERGATWVEDPSNTDTRYTRNRIRARLLPALDEAFPHFRTTFARSAAHAAQAQEVLDEIAAQDLHTTGTPPRIAALQQLSPARQANDLRFWLSTLPGATPSAAQLDELLRLIAAC
ncbi:MAG: tRNA lysidine(34) synthetase TilS, partial [Rhodocyclaceae bacterium]|nr:tRNA lysidine(34) synthetase TilS [Rhodocyclaceae bacterium]